MCSLTVGLMAAQMGMQMYQQNAQYHAQAAQYDAQIRAANFNKAAEEHKNERAVENFAEKQRQLNDKEKLAVGNARAQFGASGLDSSGGALSDSIDAIKEAYINDSKALLLQQREDSWASYVKQVGYENEMNAYNQMKHNAKAQRNIGYLGTALAGASSIYGQGYKEGLWGKSGTKAISKTAKTFGGYNFGSMYNEGLDYRP